MTRVLRQMASRPWTLAAAAEPGEDQRCWKAIAMTSTAAVAARGQTHRRLRAHHVPSTRPSTTAATAAERVRVRSTNVSNRSVATAAGAEPRARVDPVIHSRPKGSTPTANWAATFLFAKVAAGGNAW